MEKKCNTGVHCKSHFCHVWKCLQYGQKNPRESVIIGHEKIIHYETITNSKETQMHMALSVYI